MTKNWTNKIFAAFMAAACAVTLTLEMPAAMNASAIGTGVSEDEGTIVLTPEQQLQTIMQLENLSDEAREKAIEQYEFMTSTSAERTQSVSSQAVAREMYNSHWVGIPHYTQETSYWCGPATTKQTIEYVSGGTISPTQSALANSLGTTTAGTSSVNMAMWLASQGYPYYSVAVSMTTRDLVNYLVSGIGYYMKPTFGGVAITGSMLSDDGWQYTTGGTLLNVSAIVQYEPDYENSLLQVTDPYIHWVDEDAFPTGRYAVPLLDYYDAMTSFWW